MNLRLHTSLSIVFLYVVIVGYSLSGVGQSSQPVTTQMLIQGLHSSNWLKRSSGFEKLRGSSVALRSPEVRQELIALLDRENKLVEGKLRESNETVGVSDVYGEAYGEYVSNLAATVASFIDWREQREVCIVIDADADIDAPNRSERAIRANSAIPCVLTELGSDLRVVRFEAMNKLIEYYSEAAPVIAPATAQSVRRLVTDALHDSDVEVRGNTAVAVGMHGTAEWTPLLREVAEADPSPEIGGVSVRKTAARAIRRIQERMAKK